jgi:predicted AAA+ superfamily ATPase
MIVRTEDFKHVISEWLTQGPPNALEREISIPLESNLIITVTGGRRTGKLTFYSVLLTN